jgi:hypothetical protein
MFLSCDDANFFAMCVHVVGVQRVSCHVDCREAQHICRSTWYSGGSTLEINQLLKLHVRLSPVAVV